MLLAFAATAHAQVITTIAGADRLFPGSSLNALAAPLGQITGLAIDSQGNLYVADTGNNMVMRLAPDGSLVAIAGNGKGAFSGDGGPALRASLHDPGGLAVDGAGNLYIADEFNQRIRKVTPDGTITTLAGSGTPGYSGDGGPAIAAQLSNPSDVKIDAAGNLYIADSLNHVIRKVAVGGVISTIAGNHTAGYSGEGKATAVSLNLPVAIVLDGSSNLYISDSFNQRIRKVSTDGTITTVAGNGTAGFGGDNGPGTLASVNVPADLAIDGQGNLYIVDSVNNRLRKLSAGGTMTTVAGNGVQRFSGDGGPAVAASLDTPNGVVTGGAGVVWITDTNNRRVRRIASDGTINTVAGNGGPFGGDGGPASGATLNYAFGVASDGNGNLYVADTYNNRIRKIAADGSISTVAGTGVAGFGGDGGSALKAQLNTPSGVSLDSAGNIYIADTYNDRIRRVSAGGIMSTVAGSGTTGYSGDGGAATAAALNAPRGVTAQGNNIFIADSRNNRVRKIAQDGTISTIAGSGAAGSSGNGGAATAAALNNPASVAVDGQGNVYIADTLNNQVRKVTPAGIISAAAGSGVLGGAGDGGPAIQATFYYPTGVTVDSLGNLFIVDGFNCKVRSVSAADGIVRTFAGNGTCQSSGDGGLATNASLNYPYGIAGDGAGNYFIADTASSRVRAVLAPGATIAFQAAPTKLNFAADQGGTSPAAQAVFLSSLLPGIVYSSAAASSWLKIDPSNGSIPASLNISADPSGLAAGTYTDSITVTVPTATAPIATIAVTFNVGSPKAPSLSIDPVSLKFSAVQGTAGSSAQIHVSNTGSGSVTFTTTAGTNSGGAWLSVSPSSGVATPSAPVTLTVTVDASTLVPGTYLGSIILGTATTTTTIPVTLLVTAPRAIILLSQTGLSFRSAAVGKPLPQAFAIINAGQGSMTWAAKATVLSGSSAWLQVSPTGGTLARPLLDVSQVQVAVDPSGLSPGDYYGRIDVTAVASNTPQTITVVLTVVQPGEILEPEVQPIGLVFTGTAGISPGSQDILIGNPKGQADNFLSSQIGTSFSYKPASSQLLPGQPQTLRVYPDFTQLSGGTIQHGTITLQFADGTARTISVLTVVSSSTGGGQSSDHQLIASGACTPTQLIPTFTALGSGNPVPAGYPVTIKVKVVDDCGSLFTSGSVQASFSNGDAPLGLVNLQDGNWSQTWQVGAHANTVLVTVTAKGPSGLIGVVQSSIGQQGEIQLPTLAAGGLVNASSLLPGPFAPGDVILIRGSSLADGMAASSSSPLQMQLAGAAVAIGGRLAPLLYADMNQVLALVPPDLQADTPQQLLVQRDALLGVGAGVIISAAHPGILTQDGTGTGQALLYAVSGANRTLADTAHPLKPGDSFILYCTGLGATDANGNVQNPVTVSMGGQKAVVSYSGVALSRDYPSSGAPKLLGGLASAGLGGLYQVNATVPAGVPNGSVGVSVSASGQSSQASATVAISGGSLAPSITSVGTAGGFPDIAQNTWIEIKGSNLAPPNAASGKTWDGAPEFSLGMLPAQLSGVTVAVNGKTAFVYYISPTQINALTPLDAATGQVQVVVSNAGLASAPFTVTKRDVAPSFFLLSPTRYVAAVHADGTLVGPTQLSAPGFPFAPARPGETISLFAAGFGLPGSPLTNGSSSQSGTLPSLPSVQIGGAAAQVSFAGVINPGLYQINVTVPATAANGDNVILCSYGGFSTPADLISIQQ